LGGSFSLTINEAINNAYNLGTIVVVAAGNENSNACDSSPASAEKAITVASSNINDKRSSFSNYGNCVDIYAPGSSIKSAASNSNNGFTFYQVHLWHVHI